jgi:hypothetical protein
MTTPDWQWFLDRGLRPFPVSGMRDGVCRCTSGKNCTSPGKHPKFKGWQDSAGTPQAMDRWRDGDNVGVATGRGLVVLDWDGRPTVSSYPTLKVSTPSGGEHWYFTTLRPVRNGIKVFDGILDIRGEGGFVVAPPSTHVSGGQYTWLGDVTTVASPPNWVQRLLPPERKVSREMMRWPLDDPETESIFRTDMVEEVLCTLRETPRGERNAALFRAACEVTELICSGGISRDRLTDVADVGVEIGLSPAEVKRTMASAVRTVATSGD